MKLFNEDVEMAKSLGFYAYWNPNIEDGHGWVRCDADHPHAVPDLNRLLTETNWATEREL